MIQELLYTSHEGKGLRQGTGGGFCTVLSTEGMAGNLASMLEKLSGYKHPFDIHDPRAADNPVNYRLAHMSLGGVHYRVLSRVADYRKEHTGRSNKLAHHVVLTTDQLPPGGPTHALRHPGLCRDDWDGRVELVPPVADARLPQGEPQARPCDAWRAACGDAGWAGTVADALLGDRRGSINVIVPLKTDTLTLSHEVLSLIPPEKRWDITFSTYYASAVPGSSCRMRFLLDDTPEAMKVRRDHRLVKIDLANSLGPAADTPRVDAARSGDLSALTPKRAATPKSTPPSRGSGQPPERTESSLEPELQTPSSGAPAPWADPEAEYGLEPPVPLHRSQPRSVRAGATAPRGAVRTAVSPQTRLSPVVIGLVSAVAVLSLLVVGLVTTMLVFFWDPSPTPLPIDDGSEDRQEWPNDERGLGSDPEEPFEDPEHGDEPDKEGDAEEDQPSDTDKDQPASESVEEGAESSDEPSDEPVDPLPPLAPADAEEGDAEPNAPEEPVGPTIEPADTDAPPTPSPTNRDQYEEESVVLSSGYFGETPTMRVVGVESAQPSGELDSHIGRTIIQQRKPDGSVVLTLRLPSGSFSNDYKLCQLDLSDGKLSFRWYNGPRYQSVFDKSAGSQYRSLVDGVRHRVVAIESTNDVRYVALAQPEAPHRLKSFGGIARAWNVALFLEEAGLRDAVPMLHSFYDANESLSDLVDRHSFDGAEFRGSLLVSTPLERGDELDLEYRCDERSPWIRMLNVTYAEKGKSAEELACGLRSDLAMFTGKPQAPAHNARPNTPEGPGASRRKSDLVVVDQRTRGWIKFMQGKIKELNDRLDEYEDSEDANPKLQQTDRVELGEWERSLKIAEVHRDLVERLRKDPPVVTVSLSLVFRDGDRSLPEHWVKGDGMQ